MKWGRKDSPVTFLHWCDTGGGKVAVEDIINLILLLHCTCSLPKSGAWDRKPISNLDVVSGLLVLEDLVGLGQELQ